MTALYVGQPVRVVGYHMTGLTGRIVRIERYNRRLNYVIRSDAGDVYEGFERPDIRPVAEGRKT